jgi:ACS family hexuronate transporter-like MFS transporter
MSLSHSAHSGTHRYTGLTPALFSMTKSTARWGVVSVFALASTWNYLDRLVLAAAAPRVRAEFHLDNAQYGWVISAFSISYALASPATGWLLDRLGVEIGIAWAVAMWSLSSVLGGLSRGFGQLLGARTMLGAFESAGVPAAGKLNASYLEPKNRAIGAAVTQVGLSLAGVAAPLLVAAMPGWRKPFFVCAALGILWIPLFMFIRRRVAPYEVVLPQRDGWSLQLLRDRRLQILVLANILWMGIYTLWSNWTTPYLTQTFGLTVKSVAVFAWFPPVASTMGAFAGGWISRWSIIRGAAPVRARIFGACVSAMGCLVTLAVPACRSPLTAMLAISASYFWATAGSVNLYTIPVDIWGGERAGTAISALVFGYGILQAAISPLIGFIVDHHGYAPACWLVAVLPMGGCWLLRSLRGHRSTL